MDDRLKQIIFKQLYRELGDCEMIPYKDSIWFIDREKEYWYFEFDKSGTLWWRYHFFTSYFKIFSMSSDDFTPILFCTSFHPDQKLIKGLNLNILPKEEGESIGT